MLTHKIGDIRRIPVRLQPGLHVLGDHDRVFELIEAIDAIEVQQLQYEYASIKHGASWKRLRYEFPLEGVVTLPRPSLWGRIKALLWSLFGKEKSRPELPPPAVLRNGVRHEMDEES
jgi:hypothetical protein